MYTESDLCCSKYPLHCPFDDFFYQEILKIGTLFKARVVYRYRIFFIELANCRSKIWTIWSVSSVHVLWLTLLNLFNCKQFFFNAFDPRQNNKKVFCCILGEASDDLLSRHYKLAISENEFDMNFPLQLSCIISRGSFYYLAN